MRVEKNGEGQKVEGLVDLFDSFILNFYTKSIVICYN